MLHAQLRGKLARLAHRHLNELQNRPGAQVDWENAVRGDEDSLTSTVFSRFAYLEGDVLATLMDSAVQGNPELAPWPGWPKLLMEAPRFWPRLKPTIGDSNSDYIEPDIVLVYDECIIIVEAKWRESDHSMEQWLSQILATREAYPGREVRLLAVGPRNGNVHAYRALARATDEQLRALKKPIASMAWMDWYRLYEAVEQKRKTYPALPLPSQFVLNDLSAALEHRGYAQPRWLSELATIRRVRLNSGALMARWRSTTEVVSGGDTQSAGTVVAASPTSVNLGLDSLVGQPSLRYNSSNLLHIWRLRE